MRVIEVSMEQCRNERARETGDPREYPPTNGIVWHDSHMRKSGVTQPGSELGSLWWDASRLTAQSPWPRMVNDSAMACIKDNSLGLGLANGHINPGLLAGLPHPRSVAHNRLSLAFHQGEPGSIPGRITGFSQVGIVPDDAVGRQVFSRISRFPTPSFRRHSIFTSITRIGCQDLAVESCPNLFTHSPTDCATGGRLKRLSVA
ncbi:hypothetical protein PR048_008854 [Dryococelus australis]|uniref:Uncharacterized protein n=1 Tax=Dryococelus australis TaxID=614101 RepID=A0ABQ9HYA4_9NEOP|nr:hypothetical protein PR048_008854 [Dryococelus australis]